MPKVNEVVKDTTKQVNVEEVNNKKVEDKNDNKALIKELQEKNALLSQRSIKLETLLNNLLKIQISANSKPVKTKLTASASDEELITYLHEVNFNLEAELQQMFNIYQLLLDKYLA